MIHQHCYYFETLIIVYLIYMTDLFKYIYGCPRLDIFHSCKLHIAIDSEK